VKRLPRSNAARCTSKPVLSATASAKASRTSGPQNVWVKHIAFRGQSVKVNGRAETLLSSGNVTVAKTEFGSLFAQRTIPEAARGVIRLRIMPSEENSLATEGEEPHRESIRLETLLEGLGIGFVNGRLLVEQRDQLARARRHSDFAAADDFFGRQFSAVELLIRAAIGA
jgi:hypothetical protein